jgi:hypothetical protein
VVHRPVKKRLSRKAHRNPQGGPVVRAQSNPLLIPLTQRALYQRLSRALARDGKRLKKTRAAPARSRLGDFFIVNDSGGIVAHHVDLRALARELGVLQSYEQITKD